LESAGLLVVFAATKVMFGDFVTFRAYDEYHLGIHARGRVADDRRVYLRGILRILYRWLEDRFWKWIGDSWY
jgi:hypothetical protein